MYKYTFFTDYVILYTHTGLIRTKRVRLTRSQSSFRHHSQQQQKKKKANIKLLFTVIARVESLKIMKKKMHLTSFLDIRHTCVSTEALKQTLARSWTCVPVAFRCISESSGCKCVIINAPPRLMSDIKRLYAASRIQLQPTWLGSGSFHFVFIWRLFFLFVFIVSSFFFFSHIHTMAWILRANMQEFEKNSKK